MYRTKSMYSRNSMFKWSAIKLCSININNSMNIFIECMSNKLYSSYEWILCRIRQGYRNDGLSEVILLSKWKANRMWSWKI